MFSKKKPRPKEVVKKKVIVKDQKKVQDEKVTRLNQSIGNRGDESRLTNESWRVQEKY